VEFRQNTIEQILESEYAAASSARQRYGKHYDNAQAISVYLTSFLESFDQSRWVFGSFIGEVKKHQVLSLLSAVRLHKVQAMMNLRQVVEAGACAAYAIANPDHNDFVDTDEHGILDPSQRLARKRYKWLDENYPDGSKAIKDIKEELNKTTSHANLINAYSSGAWTAEDWFSSPFFDVDDPYHVQTDLWRIGNAGLVLMLFFHEINSTRNVLKFTANFVPVIQQLRIENESIRADMMASPRFQAAMEKDKARRSP
jgi:hypothetical protein